MSMKWHRFPAYFGLWVGVLANVISGIDILEASGMLAGCGNAGIYSSLFLHMGAVSVALAVQLIRMRSPAETGLLDQHRASRDFAAARLFME